MSADMPADKECNCQKQNPYNGFSIGIPQQGKQGSYNMQGQFYKDMFSKWFLIFSPVSLHSTKTVYCSFVHEFISY